MLKYPQYIGNNPIYHIGIPIVINHKPESMDNPLNKYTINLGHPILASKYDSGPINNMPSTIMDAANAKLAIILALHQYPKNPHL